MRLTHIGLALFLASGCSVAIDHALDKRGDASDDSGDASDSDDSGDGSPPVETIAPTVVNVTPGDGATVASADVHEIVVTFSEAIDCDALPADAVALFENGSQVPGELVCDGASISFAPLHGMPTRTSLVASVSPQVSDQAGNVLGTSSPWSFNVSAWTRMDGTDQEEFVGGVITDAHGNVYVGGSTRGSLEGNVHVGEDDAVLLKYDKNGTLLWARQFGTQGYDAAIGPSVDSDSNVYVAGATNGSLDGNTHAGDQDIFLVKFHANGTRLWTRQLGSASGDYARAVSTDSAGNVYVTGGTGGALDGNSSVGFTDMFLVKYDSNGTKLWTRQLGSATNDQGMGICTNAAGHVYVTGYTLGGFDGQFHIGNSDAFLVKYDSSGTKQWARQIGNASANVANGVFADTMGNVFVTGQTTAGLNGVASIGNGDVFVIKYDSSDVELWTRLVGSSQFDEAFDVSVDVEGNVYLTGYTSAGLDGNTSVGSVDAFLVKYDTSGMKLWTRQFGSTSDDRAIGVSLDAAGSVFIAGHSFGSIDYPSAGMRDIFVARYQQDGRLR